MDQTLIVKKLRSLLQGVPGIEKNGSEFYGTAEFNNWRSEVLKWLRLGEEYTKAERLRFLNLRHWYFLEHGGFDSSGPEFHFASAMVEVSDLLRSAIENMELQLISGTNQQSATDRTREGSSIAGVTIHQADNIVLGDRNSLTIDRRTIQNFFHALETDLASRVPEPQRSTLLSKIGSVLKHPAVTAILNDTLTDLFKRHPI